MEPDDYYQPFNFGPRLGLFTHTPSSSETFLPEEKGEVELLRILPPDVGDGGVIIIIRHGDGSVTVDVLDDGRSSNPLDPVSPYRGRVYDSKLDPSQGSPYPNNPEGPIMPSGLSTDEDSEIEEPLPFLEYCRCKINMAGPVAGTKNCCSEEQQQKIEDAYKGIMRRSSSIRSDLSKYKGLMECMTETFAENKICCLDPDNRGDANRFDGQSKYIDMDIWINPSTKEIMVDMSFDDSVVDYLEKLLFAMIYYCSIKDRDKSTNNEVGAIIDAIGIVGQITGRYMTNKQFISIMNKMGQIVTGNAYITLGKWVLFYEAWGVFFSKDEYNKKSHNNKDRLEVIFESEIGGFSDWSITKAAKKKRDKYINNKLK